MKGACGLFLLVLFESPKIATTLRGMKQNQEYGYKNLSGFILVRTTAMMFRRMCINYTSPQKPKTIINLFS